VIIPSATAAQIGGLIEIIDRYEVGEVIVPEIIGTSTVLNELMKDIRSKKIHIKEVKRRDVVEIEEDLHISVLFPNEDFKFNKTSLPELGIDLEYQRTHAFLLGNLSKTIQKDILKELKVKDDQNIVEFYNSMADGKISDELLEAIKPVFTWNTKEKTTRMISDGFSWVRID
jgi:competence protein ComEC